MRWEDERYVRLYTRDTNTWRLLGWEGQCVLALLFRRVDRAGVLDSGGVGPEEAICLATGIPIELVTTAWPRMLKTGTIVVDGPRLVIPNFLEAQEARSSDAERQRKSRELARVTKRDRMESRGVTNGHDLSQPVTSGHTASQPVTPSLAVPSRAVPGLAEDRKPSSAPAGASAVPLAIKPTVEIAKAYISAFKARWGASPFKDDKPDREANALLARVVQALGAEEAPLVAAYFLTSNDRLYLTAKHPLNLLKRDARKLRAEWAGARRSTETASRQQDQTQANLDGWEETRNELVAKRT